MPTGRHVGGGEERGQRRVAEAGLGALQRLGALQARCSGRISCVAAPWSVAAALQRPDDVRCSVLERCQSLGEAGVGAMQRPGPLQERCRGWIRCVAVSWSVAGALQRPDSVRCSVLHRCTSVAAGRLRCVAASWSVPGAWQERCRSRLCALQRPGALQERCSSRIRCVPASWSLAGPRQRPD